MFCVSASLGPCVFVRRGVVPSCSVRTVSQLEYVQLTLRALFALTLFLSSAVYTWLRYGWQSRLARAHLHVIGPARRVSFFIHPARRSGEGRRGEEASRENKGAEGAGNGPWGRQERAGHEQGEGWVGARGGWEGPLATKT
jgi:hypothetical protein